MNPARILIIRSTSSYGGAERQIVGFAKRLDPGIFQPVICGFADDVTEENRFLDVAAANGLRTTFLNTSSGFDWEGIKHLIQLVKDIGFDLLCPQDYRANVYAVAAGRRLDIPIVATAHGYTGHSATVKVYEAFDRLCALRWMNHIVCVSDALKVRLSRWGVPGHKLTRVHNSVDMSEYDEVIPTGKGSHPIVCTVGRLSVEKGHRYLLSAWRDVLSQIPSAKLVFVGDGPERERLARQAEELDISHSVGFIGFTDSPMEHVKMTDVFVLPSIIEGLPVALLEACSASKPVVATDVGGISEVITTGENGILVKSRKPEQLAEAIIRLLEHPDKAKQMGKTARFMIESRFSFEQNVPLLQEVYLPFLKSVREASTPAAKAGAL